MALELSSGQLDIVRQLLKMHVPHSEVRAFGSRVAGNAKPASNLDLVIMGDDAPPREAIAALLTAFSASDLPYKVDVVCWAGLSDEFREIINRSSEIVQDA